MTKRRIWCEISCGCCGGCVGLYYKNRDSIQILKTKTEDWVYDNKFGNICPECEEERKKDSTKLKS